MEKYDKLKEIKNEDLRTEQDYMKEKAMDNARMAFRIRAKMVKTIKMNFKNMYRNNLKCEECDAEEEETQEHVLECPGWVEERRGLDLLTMRGKVEFFKRILMRKMK